jgi:anti-sigma factor RsiW
MNCAESRMLLHAYADGELDVANSLELERHLKVCPACVAEQESLRSLKAALREPQLRYTAPDSLGKEIRQLARAPVADVRPRLFQSLVLWKSLALGATALALLALWLRPGVAGHDELINEAVDSHIRSLMVEHLTDIASSDQHTVKPWFTGRLDFAPDVKDHAAQGFPLVGGRLDYLNGRSVAALVYRRNKHLINVFIWPTATTSSGREKIEKRRGYYVINRDTNGLHYCLVSDLNEKELAELAGLLGR